MYAVILACPDDIEGVGHEARVDKGLALHLDGMRQFDAELGIALCSASLLAETTVCIELKWHLV